MGLKILTGVKLFLYDCQNNSLTPSPEGLTRGSMDRRVIPGLRPGDGDDGSAGKGGEAERRKETDVP